MTKYHPGWIFAALFLFALVPRLYSAQTLGWDWDHPGSFTLINFDEGGSCRAAMDGFSYSTFIGQQTIAIASAIGHAPAPGISGDQRAVKSYCHSAGHIVVARSYSALLGSLTVLVLVCIGLQLAPSAPAVAWTAGGALCCWYSRYRWAWRRLRILLFRQSVLWLSSRLTSWLFHGAMPVCRCESYGLYCRSCYGGLPRLT